MILIAGILILPAVLSAQFDQSWVNTYNGQYGSVNEGGRCVTVGADGYIYACGKGLGTLPVFDDFVTIKIDPSTGEVLWVRYYDGPAHRSDSAMAIAVDNAGGVYVTGLSQAANNYDDYVTVKYNAADGSESWVARYDYNGGADRPAAIAVDNSGGVYVTGYSHIYGTNQCDYATIGYDAADGSPHWVARYDYSGYDDRPAAIAVDNSGGVYVTGWSSADGWTSTMDYATVKYNATDGSQSWVVRYNGTGNASDRATAIAVDNAGGVYVTGLTYVPYYASDYATVKYNAADGSQCWAVRYGYSREEQPYAIALDNAGGVYVTGFSSSIESRLNYATVKYSASDGSPAWLGNPGIDDRGAVRYNGPGNGDDWATGVAVDNSGGVYVTGYCFVSGSSPNYDRDYATVRYSAADGSETWVARHNGSAVNSNDRAYAIAVDNSGGVYVTGADTTADTKKDFVTIKYGASDGGEAWVARWNLAKSTEYGEKVACDADGFAYTCGHGNRSIYGDEDFIVTKYDPATGETLWVRYYGSPGYYYDDKATAIALDNSGGVYVTGYCFYNGGAVYDYVTVKYDAAGNELWVARYNGPGNYADAATAIAVDNAGGVYVTGSSAGVDRRPDYATIKYNAADGSQVWLARYSGPAGDYDRPYDIVLDGTGGVYVTGYSVGVGTGPDYLTVRYDAIDGSETWVARYNGPFNDDDYPQAMALDNSGGVYVTGYSWDDVTANDYLTIKYSAADGSQTWLARYAGPTGDNDYAYDIAADDAGGVYVTGYGYDSLGWYNDYVTIKYNAADGSQAWLARYDGPTGGVDCAKALAVDAAGVYVTGYSQNSLPNFVYGYATVWYDRSSGEELASARHESWASELAGSIATGPLGNIYVTGTSYGVTEDILTVKYDAVVTDPDPWGGSMLAQGYWTKHPYYDPKHPDDPYVEQYLPVTVAGEEVTTVAQALAILNPPKPMNQWKMFLAQLLAAKLNAGWQTDPSLLTAWYDLPGGDYPFDNQQVSAIFDVADGYRSTTDKAVLDEMKTVLWYMNSYTKDNTRCLWDGRFPPNHGPQGAGVTALAPKLNLSVTPSLVKGGIVRIAYGLPTAAPAQLKVMDIAGRTVATRELSAGSRTGALSIDLGNLNAGVYVVRVTGADLSVSRKFVVLR
ncbi:MAG: SBBP repeat-containing protein [bacterium]